MAPKKKTKANKLANMSEEERLRYMQHKALMEEEVHRRKRQIIGTYTNMKLKHEEYFSRLNSAKINQQWRHILRKIKREKLKEDISNLEHYEDILQRKDRLIVQLLSDFDRAEFQYSLQFQQHINVISKFLEVHHKRLPTLCLWYKDLLNNTSHTNFESMRTMLESIDADFRNMKTKRVTAKQEQTKVLKNLTSTNNDKKNDLQTKLLYRSLKVEEEYADKVAQLQRDYKAVLEQYKLQADSKLAHYKILSQKDEADISVIERHYPTMDFTKRLEERRVQLANLYADCQLEESELNSRKNELAVELRCLRRRFEEHRNIYRIQLRFLVNLSNSVFKDLNDIRKKGEQILQFVHHSEKFMKPDDQDAVPREKYAYESYDGTLMVLHKRLHTFWRVSKGVIVMNERLEKERFRARDEKDKLHKLLRYHICSFRRSRSVPRNYGF